MTNQSHPIAFDAYETLAQAYSDIAETKAENGYIEHPAIRECVGDVRRLKVLDAGCGPGIMLKWLLDNGAEETVGFDVSPAMVALAKERTGGRAALHVADMAEPLPFLPDAHFDLVTSSLAIDYVKDWRTPLNEFKRVLKSAGRLVFTVQHPMGSYDWFKPPSAFGVHLCETDWTGFTKEPVTVPDYYRSFDEIINPVINAGFRVERLTETKPVRELKDINPEKYERTSRFPTFMVIEARPI